MNFKKIINLDIIDELFEDEDDISQLTKFIELSKKTIYISMNIIKISITNQNKNDLYDGSHKIKGLSTLGLCAIPVLAETLSNLSKKDIIIWSNIQIYYNKLEEEIIRYNDW